MLFEVLIFLLLGLGLGLLTGFIPGIHPNTIVLFVPLLLSFNIDSISILVFIVSLGVSNIIADFIPSLIFGAVDSETALGVHPGQKLLFEGKGYEAIKLSVTGAVGSGLLLIAFIPVLILTMSNIYSIARPFIHYILMIIVALMIYDEKNKVKSALVFIAAGLLGLLAFELPMNTSLLLFPILAGMFGIPAILIKMKDNVEIPEQTIAEEKIPFMKRLKSIFLGTFGGVAAGFLPGIGTTEIASIATTDKNNKSFLMILGSIAISNLLLSFVAIFIIDKARSGLAVAASEIIEIGFNELLLIVIVGIIALSLASIIVLEMSKKILNKITKVNYILINKIVLISIIALIYVFTGFIGLFLTVICTCLGLIVSVKSIKRGLLMGVLVVPTIVFFAGY